MTKRKKIFCGIGIALGVLILAIAIFALSLHIEYVNIKNTELPRIDVYTKDEQKIKSKEVYVECTVSLSGAEEVFCFSDLSAGIRGRGNDTWNIVTYWKKPYRIKFDEKTSLFGESENKSWVLLAMFNDFSYSKDRLAFSLADSLDGEAFVPSYHYVELYLNGKYNGLYLLTDQVDENKGRTSVKEDFTHDSTEVPFLVELDAYAPNEGEEGVDWFTISGKAYNIKYPEADERYTAEQFNYIKGYIETVDALCRKTDVTIAELEEVIDVESFIDFYLVQEAMGQPEINWKSIYMSKSSKGKLIMGPVWDFDWSATGPSLGKYAGDYKDEVESFRSVDNWFMALYSGSAEFRDKLEKRWIEVMPKFLDVIDTAKTDAHKLSSAARKDRLRWQWYRLDGKYPDYMNETLEYVRSRIEWMNTEFTKQNQNAR